MNSPSFRKFNNTFHTLLDLFTPKAQQSSIQVNILTPGKFRMKASAEFKHRCHPSFSGDGSLSWLNHAGNQAKRGTLSCPITSNQGNSLTFGQL
ncbi:Uncharacterised protein [Klebsiella pneumoniae]|uniref:Uncharacterized protein n=1 Tax=Klebsiella pneumoniae TaxID=573 RepID=A0A447RKV4_KLEPN|nr:Uncharacterised protein [Klebsiella pneumoniae]